MADSANPTSEMPTNTNEGNEANNHTHGEVPVQQCLDSAEIQGNIDRMLTATTEDEAKIAANETVWSFLA